MPVAVRIDAHHHFWNYSAEEYPWISQKMEVLRRDFGPDDLREVTREAGVERVVSVQARQTLAETEWLLESAEGQSWIAGVVGWVPLCEEGVEVELEKLSGRKLLKAVRHVVQDEPDDDFILREDFNRGVARLRAHRLAYDILVFGKHLPQTIRFVDQHPQQLFVLDHIAKPTIQGSSFDEQWARHLIELARRQNVWCKFSGVVTEVRDTPWTQALIRPYWDTALEAFGPERLMFGSDWPVCLLRSSYAAWVSTVEELAGELSDTQRQAFWHGNAERAYRL